MISLQDVLESLLPADTAGSVVATLERANWSLWPRSVTLTIMIPIKEMMVIVMIIIR